jgi:hypothetical protein
VRRDFIDFHEVPERQLFVHGALLDWARSTHGRRKPAVSASCSGYQSPASVRGELAAPIPIDHNQARRVNSMVIALPMKHCKAVQWHYVLQSSPTAGRRYVVCTAQELAQYVIDARDMLRNRGLVDKANV